MIFSSVDYEVRGNLVRLYKAVIKYRIPARGMLEKNGILTMRLSHEYCFRFECVCGEIGCEFVRTGEHGLLKFCRMAAKRPGIIAGVAVSAALAVYFSNVVVRFEVLTEDEAVKSKIMTVLSDEGITAGTYIPDINYTVAERALKKQVEEICWAGISRDGNTLIIDVIDNIPAPKGFKTRLPCNLIACEDGVIEKLDILDGQVRLCVGSGVTKGDIIVSGEVVTVTSDWTSGKEIVTTDIDYTRSIGKVYGTFERVMVFEQPFEQRTEVSTGREETVRYFDFFNAEVPLFSKMPDGYFKNSDKVYSPKIFGMTVPIALRERKLSEYDFKTKILSEDEAKALAGEQAYRYEQNFLKDYEIKDRQCKTEVTDSGVKQTVTYTLYGVMSKESEFFIPKQLEEQQVEEP